eukprot:187797-Hanusia_phi.AAC.3
MILSAQFIQDCLTYICLLDYAVVVADSSIRGRIREEDSHQRRIHLGSLNVANDNFDIHRLGTSLTNGDSLGVAEVGDEHLLPLRLADGLAHGHGLSRSSSLVLLEQSHHERRVSASYKKRRLPDIHGSDVSDHGLVVDQRLHAALGDLRLVRGVGGVPTRVLDDVPEDGRRSDRVVVAHSDVRLVQLVLRDHVEQLEAGIRLGHGLADLEGGAVADGAGDGLFDQLAHGGGSNSGEHVLLFVIAGPIVSPFELIGMLQPCRGSEGSRVHERLSLGPGEERDPAGSKQSCLLGAQRARDLSACGEHDAHGRGKQQRERSSVTVPDKYVLHARIQAAPADHIREKDKRAASKRVCEEEVWRMEADGASRPLLLLSSRAS